MKKKTQHLYHFMVNRDDRETVQHLLQLISTHKNSISFHKSESIGLFHILVFILKLYLIDNAVFNIHCCSINYGHLVSIMVCV